MFTNRNAHKIKIKISDINKRNICEEKNGNEIKNRLCIDLLVGLLTFAYNIRSSSQMTWNKQNYKTFWCFNIYIFECIFLCLFLFFMKNSMLTFGRRDVSFSIFFTITKPNYHVNFEIVLKKMEWKMLLLPVANWKVENVEWKWNHSSSSLKRKYEWFSCSFECIYGTTGVLKTRVYANGWIIW